MILDHAKRFNHQRKKDQEGAYPPRDNGGQFLRGALNEPDRFENRSETSLCGYIELQCIFFIVREGRNVAGHSKEHRSDAA